MFFMILIGIFAGIIIKTLIPGLPTWLYTVIRLGILPLVMGLGYEIIMLAGKHNNIITRILSAPGLWMQKITTKEPTEDMLEIAIISIKCALRDEFPEFKEFFEEKPWEKKPEDSENPESEQTSALSDAESVASTELPSAESSTTDAENEAQSKDTVNTEAENTKAESTDAVCPEAENTEAENTKAESTDCITNEESISDDVKTEISESESPEETKANDAE
jgi:hypothetical protein